MKWTSAALVFVCCLTLLPLAKCTVIQFLRNNVAGPPVNFQSLPWPIDPDEGLRRRAEYVAINGLYGYKHVERLGLGEDGKTEERRQQQKLRDDIGALSYEVPSR